MHVFHSTSEFENLVVPLLRRMSYLEKLTLSLRIHNRTTFIDGNYVNNYIRSEMPYLHTFNFDIAIEHVNINQQFKPSPDDIRRTFIQRGYNVGCYIDYDYMGSGRCHVYSLTFDMEYMCYITHSFPGDIFMNVRTLFVMDFSHSFEHDFFARISRSFPLLSRLTLCNEIEQKEKLSRQLVEPEETSSIIEYSHLVELDCADAHIDYLEQFLSNLNTRLPCLSKLHVRYEQLVIVTGNFTRNSTRMNCAKLKRINFYNKMTTVHSKDFYLYFPLL
jgi:hypothetical protein